MTRGRGGRKQQASHIYIFFSFCWRRRIERASGKCMCIKKQQVLGNIVGHSHTPAQGPSMQWLGLPSNRLLAIFPAISHPLARPHCQTHLSITPTTSNNAGEEEGENSVAGAAVGVGFSTSQAAPTRFSISFALVLPSIFHPPSLAVRRHFYARRMQQATRTTSRRLLCVCVCAGEKVGGPILASISWTTQ